MPDPCLWWEPKWLPTPQELERLGVRPPVPRRDPAAALVRRRRVPVLRAGRRAGRGRGL
jgi:hypothetical protein